MLVLAAPNHHNPLHHAHTKLTPLTAGVEAPWQSYRVATPPTAARAQCCAGMGGCEKRAQRMAHAQDGAEHGAVVCGAALQQPRARAQDLQALEVADVPHLDCAVLACVTAHKKELGTRNMQCCHSDSKTERHASQANTLQTAHQA